jgi:hypothetical protein
VLVCGMALAGMPRGRRARLRRRVIGYVFHSALTAGAGPRLPVAIRIALRDLVRYRARSGAALAATTFAVFLAMAICIVASIKFDNPLNWSGPNLSASQLIVYTYYQNGGSLTQLSNAQVGSQVGGPPRGSFRPSARRGRRRRRSA